MIEWFSSRARAVKSAEQGEHALDGEQDERNYGYANGRPAFQTPA